MSETPDPITVLSVHRSTKYDERGAPYCRSCGNDLPCAFDEALASLRTQLQQAEQERDKAVARAEYLDSVYKADYHRVKAQLQQAETALRFYADPENWEDSTLYHYGTGPEDGPETIAERALAAPPPNTKEGIDAE